MNRKSRKPLYYVKKEEDEEVIIRLSYYKLFFMHACIYTKNYPTNRSVLTLIFYRKGLPRYCL